MQAWIQIELLYIKYYLYWMTRTELSRFYKNEHGSIWPATQQKGVVDVSKLHHRTTFWHMSASGHQYILSVHFDRLGNTYCAVISMVHSFAVKLYHDGHHDINIHWGYNGIVLCQKCHIEIWCCFIDTVSCHTPVAYIIIRQYLMTVYQYHTVTDNDTGHCNIWISCWCTQAVSWQMCCAVLCGYDRSKYPYLMLLYCAALWQAMAGCIRMSVCDTIVTHIQAVCHIAQAVWDVCDVNARVVNLYHVRQWCAVWWYSIHFWSWYRATVSWYMYG